MLVKAASPTGVSPASQPPATTTSQRPAAMSLAALPMLWVPAAQAVTVVSNGPRNPKRMDTVAAPALDMIIGTMNGETRRGPFSWWTMIWVSIVSSPPTPVPMMTPVRAGSALSPSSPPASSSACSAAATANWAKRSIRRTSFGPNSGVASKSGIRRTPAGGSASRPSQKASLPIPHVATTPSPVTAIRRPETAPVPSAAPWRTSIRAWR